MFFSKSLIFFFFGTLSGWGAPLSLGEGSWGEGAPLSLGEGAWGGVQSLGRDSPSEEAWESLELGSLPGPRRKPGRVSRASDGFLGCGASPKRSDWRLQIYRVQNFQRV